MRSAAKTWARMASISGASVAAQAPTQSASVETSRLMPSSAHISLCRLSGRCARYFANRTCARSSGPARPREIGWNGAGGWVTPKHFRQANFSRTCWMTLKCAGTYSSVSVMSSPELAQRAATTWTLGRRRMHKPLARQVRRQSPARGSFAFAWLGGAAWLGCLRRNLGRCLILRRVLFKLGELQFELINELAAALRGRAVLLVAQLGDGQLQRLDQLILGEDHGFQRGDIVGQGGAHELARREERLKKIAEAKAKIEARAKERYERELAEHQAKLAAREAKNKTTGKKPGGKPPQPPVEGPLPTDQINLTDEESRIMPVSGGGFEQCYNAQAVVAEGSSAGGRGRCGSVSQRQATARTDAGQDQRPAAKSWARSKRCWATTVISARPM